VEWPREWIKPNSVNVRDPFDRWADTADVDGAPFEVVKTCPTDLKADAE